MTTCRFPRLHCRYRTSWVSKSSCLITSLIGTWLCIHQLFEMWGFFLMIDWNSPNRGFSRDVTAAKSCKSHYSQPPAGSFFALSGIGKSHKICSHSLLLKGCGMGPWLVLVSPCFRENVVATCKIGSFLCSLNSLLQKNVIVLFFGNQISKWRSFEKRAIFDLLFTFFFSHQEKGQKFLQHISHSHTYTYFAHLYWLFCLTNFEKNTNLSDTVSLWYESWCWFLFAPFWNNQ